jgi:hypothetical protein
MKVDVFPVTLLINDLTYQFFLQLFLKIIQDILEEYLSWTVYFYLIDDLGSRMTKDLPSTSN